MNEEQKKCFSMLYDFAHDERLGCGNLMMFIDTCFPDPEQDEISRAVHYGMKPYLLARQEMGGTAMELMYRLDEAQKAVTNNNRG